MTQEAPPHKFATTERRQIAIALRREGATYEQIGRQQAVSTIVVDTQVTKALESIQKARNKDLELYRALEADRSDAPIKVAPKPADKQNGLTCGVFIVPSVAGIIKERMR